MNYFLLSFLQEGDSVKIQSQQMRERHSTGSQYLFPTVSTQKSDALAVREFIHKAIREVPYSPD